MPPLRRFSPFRAALCAMLMLFFLRRDMLPPSAFFSLAPLPLYAAYAFRHILDYMIFLLHAAATLDATDIAAYAGSAIDAFTPYAAAAS